MVEVADFLTEEENELLTKIHERVCEELRELIDDYLIAVKEETDVKNILKNISVRYLDVNLSVGLPEDRQSEFSTALQQEVKKDIPTDMFI